MARQLTGGTGTSRTVPVALLLVVTGCGSRDARDSSPDAGRADTSSGADAVSIAPEGSAPESSAPDAGSPDAGGDVAPPPSRFVAGVVSFSPAGCTGYGASQMPGVVEGPPVGGGADTGGTDVVSLGSGGSIVLSFGDNAIVDGPGVDFVVFENPFDIGGNPDDVYAEPGEVSVSEDGVTWVPFPCTPTVDPQAADGTGTAPPYGQCAGWHPVYSTPENGISPFDAATAGGDPFDLAAVGLARARFVRIVDKTNEACPTGPGRPDDNGFDLDAIAIVNAELP